MLKIKNRNYLSIQSYRNQVRKANHIGPSFYLLEMLNGLLLGDGSFTISENGKSAFYSHGDKNESYIYWLSNELSKSGLKQCGKIIKMKVKNKAYKYKSLFYFELYEFAKLWYPNEKKIIPDYIKIRPNILKHWYIGDGNYSDAPLIDSSIFNFNRLKKICKEFNNLMIKYTLRKFKDRMRIRISKKSEIDFFMYMLSDDSYVHPCYRYKFNSEVLENVE